MGAIKRYFADKAVNLLRFASNVSGDFGIALSNFGWSDSGGARTSMNVDEKSALAISTNWNCQNGIAQDVAKLPFKMLQYGYNSAGLETRTTISGDPIAKIFSRQFNPRMTAYTGKQMMLRWKKGIGNAYAEIVRDGRDVPIELYPIHPSRVPPDMAKTVSKCDADIISKAKAWGANPDSLIFCINNNDGSRNYIAERDMLWLKNPSDDGYFGISSVSLMQNTLGLDSAVSRFLKHFYQNQARPAMIVTTENTLQKAQREELKRQWSETYEGPINGGKTVVLDRGMKVSSFQQTFEAMELTDLRKMSRQDIAAFYRFPLHKLMVEGEAQGWSTLDAKESDYVNDCLINEIEPFEQEIQRQLMCPYGAFSGYADDVNCHIETKGLLKGDIKSRTAYLQFRFNTANITPNEIREIEDENPLDDPAMNQVYIQGAMVPLKLAGMQIQAALTAADNKEDTTDKADTVEPDAVIKFEKASRLGKALQNGKAH